VNTDLKAINVNQKIEQFNQSVLRQTGHIFTNTTLLLLNTKMIYTDIQ